MARPRSMASKAHVDGNIFSYSHCDNRLHHSGRGREFEDKERRHFLALCLEWYRDGNMCVCAACSHYPSPNRTC